MEPTQRKWDRAQCIKGAMLLAAFAVFALLTEWLMNKEEALQIGLQLNACMLLLYALGAFLFLRGQWRAIKPEALFVALAALALALLMRLGLFGVVSRDYTNFLSKWIGEMRQYEGTRALAAEIGNYNVPYIYLLFLIAKLRPLHAPLYIKLASVAFDFVVATAVRGLVAEHTAKRAVQNAAFLATLCIPTVILNSAAWGQCDAIYASMALLGLLCGMRGRSKLCYLWMALAFSVKMQTVFILPMVVVLILCGRVRLRDAWVFIAAFFATLVPALLAGRSLPSLLSIYGDQVGNSKYLNLFATSWLAWGWGGKEQMMPLQYMGLGLAFTGCLAFLYYCYIRRKRLDGAALLEGTLFCSVMIPFFLPFMHERYFYLAELLVLPYLFIYPKRWPVAAAVWLCGWIAYLQFLLAQVEPAIPLNVMTISMFFVLCYVGSQFVRRVEGLPEPVEQPRAE